MSRPLPLRSEQPPDDATVVLRAGVMSADNVRWPAERTFDPYDVYGISVEGVLDMTVLHAAAVNASWATERCGCRPSVESAARASLSSPHLSVPTSHSSSRV